MFRAVQFFFFLTLSCNLLLFENICSAQLLPDIDTSASQSGVVPLPSNGVNPSLLRVFDKYAKIVAPNGKPIHILGQNLVTEAQMVRAREIMQFYLSDHPGSSYGSDKSGVANAMSNRSAVLMFFNNEQAAQNARSQLSNVEYNGQSLYANESVITGSPEYLNNTNRDASFEEIFHLVHDQGIMEALPQYQVQIQAALTNARPNRNSSPSNIWTITEAFYDELAAEGSLTQEYIISTIDVYYGLWAHESGSSFFGEYVPTNRANLATIDPMGFQLMLDYFPDRLSLTETIDQSFVGTFSLVFDPAQVYTHKSRYLQNVRLSGSNAANVRGNDYNNMLTGNIANNELSGSGGDDELNGAQGVDTAVYRGRLAEYRVSNHLGVATVSDLVPNRDGTDTLVGIELLRFADVTIPMIEDDSVSLYLTWNTFLRQIPVIGLTNKGESEALVTLLVYDGNGQSISQFTTTLGSTTEQDVLLHLLPGVPADANGVVRIVYARDRAVDAHAVHYRMAENNSDVEFAITSRAITPHQGKTYAIFNTLQPSIDPNELQNEVPNWLHLVNSSLSESTSFTVNLYDMDGTPFRSFRASVPALGRRDLRIGAEIVSDRLFGLVEVVPDNESISYIAQLYHYGTQEPSSFSFASGTEARVGSESQQNVPISSGGNADNWLALANSSAIPAAVSLRVFSNQGELLLTSEFSIGAKAQRHINAAILVPGGNSGLVEISSTNEALLIAKSTSYFRNSLGQITTVAAAVARESSADSLSAPYNFFLNQFNWLRVYNTSDLDTEFQLEVFAFDGTLLGQASIPLAANSGIDLEPKHTLGLDIPNNSYGLLKVTPAVEGSLISWVLRIKPQSLGLDFDLAKFFPLL